MTSSGYLSILLHAHLPFVRHPADKDFLEEDWFHEAISESYAPLLIRLETLAAENVPFRLAWSVSPTLAAMLENDLLIERFGTYMERKKDFLLSDAARGGDRGALASRFLHEAEAVTDFVFNRCGGRLLSSLRRLRDAGRLELLCCNATHAFLPLVSQDGLRDAQIRVALRSHERLFGERPRGLWLAECGYTDGLDALLAKNGLSYAVVESHGILYGDPQPAYGVYAPVLTRGGVNVFGRDEDCAREVWSRDSGFPGDPAYREFHRDAGMEGAEAGARRGRRVGVKYHRVTGPVPLDQKALYNPDQALARAAEHAALFLRSRRRQIAALRHRTAEPPIIVAPFDAELFGHWWHEGPHFLDRLIRMAAFDQKEIEMIAPSDHLARHSLRQLQSPCPSSWGAGGYNAMWLNGGNAWMYRHQHRAEAQYLALSASPGRTELERRALRQLLRELLLLQSSDWAFLLSSGASVSYATRRFRDHLDRFRRLADGLRRKRLDPGFVAQLEDEDPVFTGDDLDGVLDSRSDERAVVKSA